MLFPPDQQENVRVLLRDECGDNLPFQKGLSAEGYDPIRLAVLKLSNRDMQKLQVAVRLANSDWRDVLVASGFARSPELR
jgi:hypothetical protein